MGLSKIKPTYFLFCEACARDAQGKLSFIGVFDRVFSARFPAVHSRIVACVGLLGPQNETASLQVALHNSQDVDVVPRMPEDGIKVQFSPHGTVSAQIELNGVPLMAPGIYALKPFQTGDDSLIAEQTLWVDQTT